jgi:hypothetical protein
MSDVPHPALDALMDDLDAQRTAARQARLRGPSLAWILPTLCDTARATRLPLPLAECLPVAGDTTSPPPALLTAAFGEWLDDPTLTPVERGWVWQTMSAWPSNGALVDRATHDLCARTLPAAVRRAALAYLHHAAAVDRPSIRRAARTLRDAPELIDDLLEPLLDEDFSIRAITRLCPPEHAYHAGARDTVQLLQSRCAWQIDWRTRHDEGLRDIWAAVHWVGRVPVEPRPDQIGSNHMAELRRVLGITLTNNLKYARVRRRFRATWRRDAEWVPPLSDECYPRPLPRFALRLGAIELGARGDISPARLHQLCHLYLGTSDPAHWRLPRADSWRTPTPILREVRARIVAHARTVRRAFRRRQALRARAVADGFTLDGVEDAELPSVLDRWFAQLHHRADGTIGTTSLRTRGATRTLTQLLSEAAIRVAACGARPTHRLRSDVRDALVRSAWRFGAQPLFDLMHAWYGAAIVPALVHELSSADHAGPPIRPLTDLRPLLRYPRPRKALTAWLTERVHDRATDHRYRSVRTVQHLAWAIGQLDPNAARIIRTLAARRVHELAHAAADSLALAICRGMARADPYWGIATFFRLRARASHWSLLIAALRDALVDPTGTLSTCEGPSTDRAIALTDIGSIHLLTEVMPSHRLLRNEADPAGDVRPMIRALLVRSVAAAPPTAAMRATLARMAANQPTDWTLHCLAYPLLHPDRATPVTRPTGIRAES